MTAFRRYDDIEIGDRFPDQPAVFEVKAATVAGYRDLVEASLIEGEAGPTDDGQAPPTLAAVYIRPAQDALNGPPGGVHAKQSFAFHAGVHTGDRLETTLEVVEKYERKGRRYLVSATRTLNQSGACVTTGRITQIWGQER